MPFINKITINETSNSGPSGLFFKGNRYLAWQGTDNEVNVLQLTSGGGEAGKVTGELTISDPSLFTDGTNLFVAWTGTNNQLNIAQVQF
jgi:hypothetical protein